MGVPVQVQNPLLRDKGPPQHIMVIGYNIFEVREPSIVRQRSTTERYGHRLQHL